MFGTGASHKAFGLSYHKTRCGDREMFSVAGGQHLFIQKSELEVNCIWKGQKQWVSVTGKPWMTLKWDDKVRNGARKRLYIHLQPAILRFYSLYGFGVVKRRNWAAHESFFLRRCLESTYSNPEKEKVKLKPVRNPHFNLLNWLLL